MWVLKIAKMPLHPYIVGESFVVYYGEVPLQKNGLNVKFRHYKSLSSRTIFILHRRGYKIAKNKVNSQI